LIEGQFEAEVRKKFRDLTKTVERMAHVVHDRIDRMDMGHISNLMTAMLDMTERVRKMELSLEKYEKELLDLEVEISNLQTKIEIATKGR
jgi:hypothetical protein